MSRQQRGIHETMLAHHMHGDIGAHRIQRAGQRASTFSREPK